jgi:electron transfer flavoprotein alpha subunit
MRSLVVVEHDGVSIRPATFNTLSAAAQIGGEVDLLVAGRACTAVAAQAATLAGVARVWLAEAPYLAEPSAENMAALVASHAAGYSHIFAAATSVGKSFLPRVAALLDVAQISEIVGIKSADTFVRPIYAGNVLATVQSSDAVKVISVRSTAFVAATGAGAAPVEVLAVPPDQGGSRVLSRELSSSSRPELAAARVVVAGGRGLGSRESFEQLLEPLAERLEAAIGATRAAVDAGFVSNDCQVGQTGVIVAPALYVALGISGAIQHLAGMQGSQVIVAINKDPEAAIFQVADYGLVADLFDAVPELTAALA